MLIRFPDAEYEAPFRAYANYLEDLVKTIGGHFSLGPSMVESVHEGAFARASDAGVDLRDLTPERAELLAASLRKSWGFLRRAQRELEDPTLFDEEANAWLPVETYYAVYHGLVAVAVASGQRVPRDHAATLRLAGKEVKRGLFPHPWNTFCEGCPQLNECAYGGLSSSAIVHVLSTPDPATREDRLAMFLRTTRRKELDRRFAAERQKKTVPGRGRRNISREQKSQIADSMAPTTLFDVFWRLRKKASYEEADVFVLGTASEEDAIGFAANLVGLTSATVGVLEGVSMAYVGPHVLSSIAEAYRVRTRASWVSTVGVRAASFAQVAGRQPFRRGHGAISLQRSC